MLLNVLTKVSMIPTKKPVHYSPVVEGSRIPMPQSKAMPGRTGHLLNLPCFTLKFSRLSTTKQIIANAKSIF